MFLGLETDGLAHNATPANVDDAVVDRLFEEYKKRYKALDEEILSRYVFASSDAARAFKDGERVKLTHMDGGMARFYSPESGTSREVYLGE